MPPVPEAAHCSASARQAGSCGWRAGETHQCGARRGGRRAGGGEQVMQREPVPARAAIGREAARRSGKLLVALAFALRPFHPHGGGMPARQLQRDHGTGVADHGVAHQFAQPLGIGGLARLAGGDVGGAEFLEGLEDARLEQGEQVVQLGEIVLDRRRRQQQQEALVQPVHELVALAAAVAQVMRLVDDDEIERAFEQAPGVLAPACQR